MSASSQYNIHSTSINGRLHFQKNGHKLGSWIALRNNVYQWIGVDFNKVIKVTMFSTQGRQDYRQWVKSYKLEYSLDGYEYEIYSIKGRPKVSNLLMWCLCGAYL